MAIKLGDVVLTRGCVADADGVDEHVALVTKVHSQTDVSCVIFIGGGAVNIIGEQHLQHESVKPTGKRFIEKGV